MGKNGKAKRAQAAKTKVLQKRANATPLTLSSSNDMINKAVQTDFVGLLKMKLRKNGLLDINLVKRDVRVPIMKYNEVQSPLLRLPGEIRNKIFRMVVGDQHVHISVSHLPQKPAEDAELPAFTMKERAPKWPRSWEATGYNNRYHEHQLGFQPWKNNTYPLDWRAHYTTQPVKENRETKYLCEMVPEKRIVWASGSHMTQLSQVCRQIYDEEWLRERQLPQRQAIKVLWLDNEWAGCTRAPDALKDLSATLKIPTLARKTVSKAYWQANKDRAIGDCPTGDIDADMNNAMRFEAWLAPARKGGRVKVEYVKE